jgi:hypothetical protein
LEAIFHFFSALPQHTTATTTTLIAMLSTTLRRAAMRRPSMNILSSQQSACVYLQQKPLVCTFSTDSKKKENKDASDGDSLRDAIHRLKQEKDDDDDDNVNISSNDFFRKAADLFDTAKAEVALTWQELVNAGKPKSINKKIHPTETAEGNAEYTGSVEIMVIDESEHLTAWERMQRRLAEAPIIQGRKRIEDFFCIFSILYSRLTSFTIYFRHTEQGRRAL